MTSRVAQLRLQLLDQASAPAKKTSGALGQLERDISRLGRNGVAGAKNLGSQLDYLREKAARAGRFTELRNGMRTTFDQFRTARSRVKELEAALASATGPTGKLKAELRSAQSTVKSLGASFRQQAAAARATERSLRSFGLNSRSAIASSQTAIRGEMAKTVAQMRKMRAEAAKPVRPGRGAGGGFWSGAAGAAAGGYVAGSMLARPVEKAISYDEIITRVAATMSGGGNLEEKRQSKTSVSNAVDAAIKQGGGTRDDAAKALDRLVASGVLEPEQAIAALPSVVKTAYASGSDSSDIAGLAVAMLNNGIGVDQLQEGFDRALKAGQMGGVELKDMSRWMPQQFALARGSGLSGMEALTWLAAGNQTALTTAGSPDEAANNLVNLLQKLNSRELEKQMADAVTPRKDDPKNDDGEFSWQRYMIQRRQAGVSAPEALVELMNRQLEDNAEYQDLLKKAQSASTPQEQKSALEGAVNIAQGSSAGEIFADRQALGGALALYAGRERQKRLESELKNASGATDAESEFIREQSFSKIQDAANARDRANETVFNQLSGPIGTLAEKVTEAAAAYPGLTSAAYGAATALAAIAGAGVVGGIAGGLAGRRGGGDRPGPWRSVLSGGSGGGRGGVGAGRFGLGVFGAVGTALSIPSDPEELKQFIEANSQRSERWNKWLEENVGSPRSWLGMGSGGSSSGSEVNKLETGIQATMAQWPIAAQQGMREYIGVLMQGGAEAESKATATGEQIKQALTVNGALTIDTSQLERALGMARQFAAVARGGSAAAPAVSPSGGSLDPKLDGKRASGGPVKKGGIYQINERGQELFAPGSDGTIIPNHKLGGGVGVTVHAPVNVTVHGGGDAASIKAAIQQGVEQAVSQLDAKLRRSLEVAFTNIAYGDA